MKPRVLITGGTGFIGSKVIPLLNASGFEVIATTRGSVDDKNVRSGNVVKFVSCDLFQVENIKEVMRRYQPSYLLHLAWEVEHGKFWTAESNLDWVKHSLELLQAFIQNGGQRVVMAGTCAEYDWQHSYCQESITPLHPATLYGASKLALYSLALAYCNQKAVSFAWGRVFLLYGPGEAANRLVPSVIRSMLENKVVSVSCREKRRDFLHVEDVASAFAKLLTSRIEGAVNIASGEPISLEQLIIQLGELTGFNGQVEYGECHSDSADPLELFGSVEKLSSLEGFKLNYTLREGLEDYVQFLANDAAVKV